MHGAAEGCEALSNALMFLGGAPHPEPLPAGSYGLAPHVAGVEDVDLTSLFFGEAKVRFDLLTLVAFPGHADNGKSLL